jgi:hypothetical protein
MTSFLAIHRPLDCVLKPAAPLASSASSQLKKSPCSSSSPGWLPPCTAILKLVRLLRFFTFVFFLFHFLVLVFRPQPTSSSSPSTARRRPIAPHVEPIRCEESEEDSSYFAYSTSILGDEMISQSKGLRVGTSIVTPPPRWAATYFHRLVGGNH